MTLLDIAQSMKGRLRDGYSPSQAGVTVENGAVEYGTAVSDSSNGFVTILMDGAPIYDPGYVESDYTFTVPVDAPVTNGDRVAYISQDGQGKAVALSSLTVLAENADTAASEAQAVANAVNQHFWDDANGAHVTEVEQDKWTDSTDPLYHTGRDITLNSNGILLREDYTTLASFTPSAVAFYDGNGDKAENVTASFGTGGAVIGSDGSGRLVVSNTALVGTDPNGTDFLNVDYYGASEQEQTTKQITGTMSTLSTQRPHRFKRSFILGAAIDGTRIDCNSFSIRLDSLSAEYSRVTYNGSSYPLQTVSVTTNEWREVDPTYCVAGSTNTYSRTFSTGWRGTIRIDSVVHSVSGVVSVEVSIDFAANKAVTVDVSASLTAAQSEISGASLSCRLLSGFSFSYTRLVSKPAFTFGSSGESRGSFSSSLGEGLFATQDHQTSLGMWNVEDTNDEYAMIVGNGSGENQRSNAFTVSWNGDIEAAGGLTLGTPIPIDSGGTGGATVAAALSNLGIAYQDFDIAVNYSAGTVGTRGMIGSAVCTWSGHVAVAATAVYVSASANYNPHVWLEGNRVYVAAYRASTSAVSNGNVTCRVLYIGS